MDISQLRIFVKIVQLGSLTKAADALSLSKAHVSRSLAALEAALEARLLQRSTRSIALTTVGRALFERATAILQSLEEAETVVRNSRQEPSGRLSITCSPEFGALSVTRWITGFLDRFPQVSIEGDYTSRVVDLIHENIDLAIRVGELRDSTLKARKLGEVNYSLFASRDYIAARRLPQHPRDLLEGHSLLSFTRGNARSVWSFSQGAETVDIPHHGRLAVNNAFALKDAVEAGLGVARLPYAIAAHLDPARTLRLLPDWTTPGVDIHAVFASSRFLSPNVRSFIDYAIEQSRQEDIQSRLSVSRILSA